MYENILHQQVCENLSSDIKQGNLPGSVLFTGPAFSGKLSCALETGRIVSCIAENRGLWQCTCDSCLRNKALFTSNIILLGFKDCSLELLACKNSFLKAHVEDASYLSATRYLFLRSVRKLTMRFNPIAWQGDEKLSKIANLVSEIDEYMERLDFPQNLPEHDELSKICNNIVVLCEKLSSSFLYNSIPIQHIRNIASWAHIKSSEGKKTIIIENADAMSENARNALLKILEEPPENVLFILIAQERSSIMPTILSRVRTYQFSERKKDEQLDVIKRIFHENEFYDGLQNYLESFLPIPAFQIEQYAKEFFLQIARSSLPDVSAFFKQCNSFEPRLIFRIFLSSLVPKKMCNSAKGAEVSFQCMKAVQNCWSSVTIFNQSEVSALENLVREFSKINKTNENIFQGFL